MFKFLKINFLLLMSLSYFIHASDDVKQEPVENDEFTFMDIQESSVEDIEEYAKIADLMNRSRSLLTGTIKFGGVEYQAELHNRRDLLSQLATSAGGKPSYYKLIAPDSFNNGVKKNGEVLRGRLQMSIDESLACLVFKFFPFVVGESTFDTSAKSGTEIMVIYVPFNKCEKGVNNQGHESIVINIDMEKSASDIIPTHGHARFYSKEYDDIELSLVFDYADRTNEALQAAGNACSSVGSAVSNAAKSTWGYIYNLGLYGTAKAMLDTASKVTETMDNIEKIKEGTYGKGDIIEAAKFVVSKEGQETIKGVQKNAQNVVQFFDQDLSQLDHEIEQLQNEVVLLTDKLIELKAEKEGYEEDKDFDYKTEIEDISANIKVADYDLQIAQTKLDIARLKHTQLKNNSNAAASTKGTINALTKKIEKLSLEK
ncbi:MAG: hypothetical protein KC505_01645 [Myxococcales bacterium]|nr:hypothetical protein [Myxococcales bacterium]